MKLERKLFDKGANQFVVTLFECITEIKIEIGNGPNRGHTGSSVWVAIEVAVLMNGLDDRRTQNCLSTARNPVEPEE